MYSGIRRAVAADRKPRITDRQMGESPPPIEQFGQQNVRMLHGACGSDFVPCQVFYWKVCRRIREKKSAPVPHTFSAQRFQSPETYKQ